MPNTNAKNIMNGIEFVEKLKDPKFLKTIGVQTRYHIPAEQLKYVRKATGVKPPTKGVKYELVDIFSPNQEQTQYKEDRADSNRQLFSSVKRVLTGKDPDGTLFSFAKQHPESIKFLPDIVEGKTNYSTMPIVSQIEDFFAPQQYRGIGNIDDLFGNAQTASSIGADRLTRQSLRAGMSDLAGLLELPGATKTVFPYKITAPSLFPTIFPSTPATYQRNPAADAGVQDFFSPHQYRGSNSDVDKFLHGANLANQFGGTEEEVMKQLDKAFSNAAGYAGKPGAQRTPVTYNKSSKK